MNSVMARLVTIVVFACGTFAVASELPTTATQSDIDPLVADGAVEDGAVTGLSVSQAVKDRDTGWNDLAAEMRMVIRNKRGRERERKIRIRTLEQLEDGNKTLMVFNSPPDIRGTALLSFTHIASDDDQWLYLPALKRVKRISGSGRSGPFVGSEFSFEDLSSFEVEKYEHELLRREMLGETPCFVVKQDPIDKDSGYSQRVVWIDENQYLMRKVEFFDTRDRRLKTLEYDGYEQYDDRFWRPGTMTMINHQTGASTDLHWSNYQLNTGLDAGQFNKGALQRAR